MGTHKREEGGKTNKPGLIQALGTGGWEFYTTQRSKKRNDNEFCLPSKDLSRKKHLKEK